jgi:hypothetical protein
MRIQNFYRVSVWLPVIVPALLGCLRSLGIGTAPRPPDRIWFMSLDGTWSMLLASLLYGGVPYGCLAIWATWWIGGRPESEIRWLMLLAPLLMVATFVPMAYLFGFFFETVLPLVMVTFLSVHIILLGYGYVALTLLLRKAFNLRA